MSILESYPKHNMVAYLEKTDGNAEFHEIIDFLTRSSIHYALIVTPQAAEIKSLKAQVKRLKKQARPFILHHKAWLRTVKRKNLNNEKVLKTSSGGVEFNLGRKTIISSKGALLVLQTCMVVLDMDIDDTNGLRSCQDDEGKTIKVNEKGGKYWPQLIKFCIGMMRLLGTCKVLVPPEQNLVPTSQAKAVSKEKEKGVEIRNAKNAERPKTTSTRSVLTLKPLPKIDPNDKGKKRIEEDKEICVLTRIEVDRLLAERVQEAERE
ncbi:hypothetical protein Tco_0752363 [Tanacetum coccineum]|uniref:Uncharacterized protein n=1 Tax=Tanacetum coccineum TaxID=301880 RepID=A0ABQ4Z9E8_9ASTR